MYFFLHSGVSKWILPGDFLSKPNSIQYHFTIANLKQRLLGRFEQKRAHDILINYL